MNLEELKQLIINKKNSLQEKKNLAYMNGNTEEYYKIDAEIQEVDLIIQKLDS